ncbi:Regulatory MIG1 [Lecanosticta acicola]|uniref:Regulatory MIG1 n=1 Tax=Lecanosticta acicola TaxID=111012 RepID=A0AAI9E6R4_9PEZI|nr:Regulatory MIG1 [Lecanosticta acicola]
MSSTTSPSRLRGIPVPGIDTRGIVEKISSPLPFQSWPLTPPQSANESRRPSLAHSALSSDTSHSGPPSINGYSQPATPVNSMSGHYDFKAQWNDGAEVHAHMSTSIVDGCHGGQVPQSMFASTMVNPSVCGTPPINAMDSLSIQTSHMGSPMPSAWSQQHQAVNNYHGLPTGLGTTLFQSSQSLGQEHASAPMYHPDASTMPSPLEASAFSRYDAPMSSASHYNQPQVVVPSQVAPAEDYPMDCHQYDIKQEAVDGFNHSFDSSMGGWESVGPPSPEDAYFAQSEEEDFAVVKDEIPFTPSQSSCYQASGFFNVGHSSRTKKRSSKRSRKNNNDEAAWYETEIGETTVRCSGPRFLLNVTDGDDRPLSHCVVSEQTKERKRFRCGFRGSDGQLCRARFERSEHLKRHKGMHSGFRPYFCPLDDCGRHIGRPDNAGDHLKTHLKPHTPGKRNKTCSWEKLEAGILAKYTDEKAATKLLTNLRKWIVIENEKALLAEQQENAAQQQQQQQPRRR